MIAELIVSGAQVGRICVGSRHKSYHDFAIGPGSFLGTGRSHNDKGGGSDQGSPRGCGSGAGDAMGEGDGMGDGFGEGHSDGDGDGDGDGSGDNSQGSGIVLTTWR